MTKRCWGPSVLGFNLCWCAPPSQPEHTIVSCCATNQDIPSCSPLGNILSCCSRGSLATRQQDHTRTQTPQALREVDGASQDSSFSHCSMASMNQDLLREVSIPKLLLLLQNFTIASYLAWPLLNYFSSSSRGKPIFDEMIEMFWNQITEWDTCIILACPWRKPVKTAHQLKK